MVNNDNTFANPLAKLVLGVPTGSAKHQLGKGIGGSVPKCTASVQREDSSQFNDRKLSKFFLSVGK